MGYLSDVAIAIKESDYNNLAKDLSFKDFIMLPSFNKSIYYEDIGVIRILIWREVKWYSTRIDLNNSLNIFMNKLRTLDEYEFLRLGQDANDIEHETKFRKFIFFSLKIFQS